MGGLLCLEGFPLTPAALRERVERLFPNPLAGPGLQTYFFSFLGVLTSEKVKPHRSFHPSEREDVC